ncbi:cell wall metabolism sensor histidine kinase WalK [Salinibacterium sp. ZJ70]|uniref:sensor histidine kinase n=1 Tax=Salinibacterium sp. ZJ70 TaxID=2708084 RepID=UPI001CD712C2|nr:ATP-binding protein [Salinibacterium sp. ZJ70]
MSRLTSVRMREMLGRQRTLWYIDSTGPTLLMRQAPSAVALIVGVTLSMALDDLPFTPFAAAGFGLIVGATIVAIVATRERIAIGWIGALIPIADLIGFGLFRAGTGGATSLFGVFLLLPLVWLAALPGYRYVIIVTVLGSGLQVLPMLTHAPSSSSEWLRMVITPAVYAVIAIMINEIARNGRLRTAEAQQLAAERAAALERNQRVLEQLQESKQNYGELVELFRSVWNAITAQAIIGTDRAGLIVTWNPGATILLGREDLDTEYAERIEAFFPPSVLDGLAGFPEHGAQLAHDPLPPGLRMLFDAVDAGATVERELDMLRDDGSTVPVRLVITQRFDGTRTPIGYLLVASDETRAIEVARMKDEFVGMISHELRTPLSSILGYLELLRDDPQNPLTEEQQQFLGIAERNAERLLRLGGDLLFTAQVESGHFALETREVDISALIVAAVESARPAADTARVRLRIGGSLDTVIARVDPVRISQAVDNLVSNALKFTPAEGEVVVTLSQNTRYIVLSVRDTGVGIPADELDRLFTRFFRASTATRNALPGVGLGLNITKAIVTAHRGRMEVSSEVGVGTEFRMILPLD